MTPNSRSYLNRFLSSDTYVPESQGVQAWDRYAYVNNNPGNLTDPTGHFACGDGIDDPRCEQYEPIPVSTYIQTKFTLTDKIIQGDVSALVDLLIPSHIGGRIQVEVSIDFVIGWSGSIGVNGVYNRYSDELAANVDWAFEPGIGIGGGGSATGGLLIGWGSSQVEDATQGYSGIISGTAAAEGAVAAAVTFPIDMDKKALYVDPHSGQVPATVYIGGGAGGAYAGIGAGLNGPTGIYANLTPLLPWHWFD